MLLYPFYQWNYRNAKRFYMCIMLFYHYITGKYLDFHEGDRFGVLLIRVGNWYFLGNCPASLWRY
jgi:hypothetical protein